MPCLRKCAPERGHYDAEHHRNDPKVFISNIIRGYFYGPEKLGYNDIGRFIQNYRRYLYNEEFNTQTHQVPREVKVYMPDGGSILFIFSGIEPDAGSREYQHRR